MKDCRNARVRLRRRLESKYLVQRVSVKSKTVTMKNDIGKETEEIRVIPRIVVTIDLNNKKDDFIKDEFPNLKKSETNFVVKVDYFENDCCDYKVSFLVDNINIGLERIKKYASIEIMDNVVPELEQIYKEVKVG